MHNAINDAGEFLHVTRGEMGSSLIVVSTFSSHHLALYTTWFILIMTMNVLNIL